MVTWLRWTYFDTHMYKNVYVGEVNIIQLVYNAGVLSRLCCTLQKYFGPVHHNQLKDNVNGMGGEMGRGGRRGPILYISTLYNVPQWDQMTFISVIRYPGMASLWNTISRIKCFLTGNVSSSLECCLIRSGLYGTLMVRQSDLQGLWCGFC